MSNGSELAGSLARLAIVDDHPVVLRGLSSLFSHDSRFTVEWIAEEAQEAIVQLRKHPPDLLILDLMLQGCACLDVLATAKCPVIIYSGYYPNELISSLFDSGAKAFLPKSIPLDKLIDVVCRVLGGEQIRTDRDREAIWNASQIILTPRELQVLKGVCEGRSNKDIASHLSIRESTVKTHVANLMNKLEAGNRVEVVLWAQRMGITKSIRPSVEENE